MKRRAQRFCRPPLRLAVVLLLLLPLVPATARTRTRVRHAKPAPASPTPAPPAEGEPNLAAQGAIVIDVWSGLSMHEKNADDPHYPASATKILTALLVIEEGDLDHEVVVDVSDTKVEASALYIKPGERFTRRQMLYGLLLKSANDVAMALARDNAGSVAAFAEKMTHRARQLGATHSQFRNPHGLHDKDHFTTARDLALIARAAMAQPLFHQIVGTQKYTWVSPAGSQELHNHNRLLGSFPGCTGVKTGYTVPAQQVLVSAAQWGTREVISVVLHTDRPGIWDDSKALLTLGLTQPPAWPAAVP
jgi:serine-type D-Ala-D-Ala carboxypeptidase (penicillin-binding protein 5/6)